MRTFNRILPTCAILMACLVSTVNDELKAQTMTQKINITIGGDTRTATLVSNSSTDALVAQLQQGSISYEANDYGNFEKVGAIGYTFPQNNEDITTKPGDLILYQGNNLCIYYATNTWDFTRIGSLDNMTQAEIKQWVNAGNGSVTVRLSLPTTTSTKRASAQETSSHAYDMAGRIASPTTKGIIIQNGKITLR